MIKANELRIGNLILFDGKITHANSRNIAYISNSNRLKNGDSIAFEPIEPTEEYLLKAGFKKCVPPLEKHLRKRITDDLYFNAYPTKKGYCFELCSKYRNNGNYWLMIHELQNMFFILSSGEELVFSTTE